MAKNKYAHLNEDELQAAQREIRAQIYNIEDHRRIDKNKKVVGKCYVYRNSFSCPSSPKDYWNLYTKIVKIDRSGYLKAVSFQTDKNGDMHFRNETFRVTMDGYKQIPLSKFNRALETFQKKLYSTCEKIGV